jgi:hypothetical protein
VGTVIYPSAHRILKGMDEQGWCDGSWQRMIDGGVSFLMDQGVINTSVHEVIGSALTYDETTS